VNHHSKCPLPPDSAEQPPRSLTGVWTLIGNTKRAQRKGSLAHLGLETAFSSAVVTASSHTCRRQLPANPQRIERLFAMPGTRGFLAAQIENIAGVGEWNLLAARHPVLGRPAGL